MAHLDVAEAVGEGVGTTVGAGVGATVSARVGLIKMTKPEYKTVVALLARLRSMAQVHTVDLDVGEGEGEDVGAAVGAGVGLSAHSKLANHTKTHRQHKLRTSMCERP